MKAIIGLGNPGKKYQETRHNVGFMVIDEIAGRVGGRLLKHRYASLRETKRASEPVLLAKPKTFMNQSGEAVMRLRDEFSLQPSDVILVHDDLDLSFGRLRIRRGGGNGGHRGVASVLTALGDPDFFRIRVGIGRPDAGEDPVDFVLSRFRREERAILPSILQRSADAAWCLVSEGAEVAMNRFNRKSPE